MPEKQSKARTIFGMDPEELQEFLASMMEKVPFVRRASTALDAARKRVEGRKQMQGMASEEE